MLSFRNAKTIDLYVNRRVSENRAFIQQKKKTHFLDHNDHGFIIINQITATR